MNRAEYIQQIVEDSSRLNRLALADKSTLGTLQLSKAQMELIYLLFFHERISVKQAAERLSVSLSAISQLADPLHDEGYLARDNDPRDRRIIYMSLTPKGKRIIKILKSSLTSGLRSIMECLDDKELASLSKIYKKMIASAQEN